MSWVAVAIGGSALLGYMGSQNAASAQTNAANQANQTQQNQYNQTRQDQLPWMNRGNAAGNQLAWLMGLPGYGNGGQSWGASSGGTNGGASSGQLGSQGGHYETQLGDPNSPESAQLVWVPGTSSGSGSENGQRPMDGMQGSTSQTPYNSSMGGYGSLSTPFSQTNWQADPGYAFRLQEGQKALERSGAAKGMTLSGAQQKALIGYGQGMGSQEYGNAYGRYNNDQTTLFNRLSGIAGTGQQANQFTGQMGANMANQIGQNQLGAGNANAAAWTAGTSALSNGLNSWNNYNTWNQMNNAGTNYWNSYTPTNPYAGTDPSLWGG